MAIRDVAGELRVGMFDKVTLPDGRVAKPKRGNGKQITYDVDGKEVVSTSRYAPHRIQYDADGDDFYAIALPMRSPNRKKR